MRRKVERTPLADHIAPRHCRMMSSETLLRAERQVPDRSGSKRSMSAPERETGTRTGCRAPSPIGEKQMTRQSVAATLETRLPRTDRSIRTAKHAGIVMTNKSIAVGGTTTLRLARRKHEIPSESARATDHLKL